MGMLMENETKTSKGVLTYLYKGYGIDLQCSGILACQGTLWNQSETMRTSREAPETSKRAKQRQMGDFQRRQQSWHTFVKVIGDTQVVLDFSHVRVPYGTTQRQWRLQRSRQEHKKRPERAQMVKRVVFKRDSSLDAPFSRYLKKIWVLCTFHMWGCFTDAIRDNEDFEGAIRNVKTA